jgi:hypothetical protein
VTDAAEHLVRVTHVFHPLFALLLPCVGRRYNRHGERLLLQADDARIWSVPPQWTDLARQDLDVAMGDGRTVLRFSDLMDLTDLVARMSKHAAVSELETCKGDNAASVRLITPRREQSDG